ncbi:hypothetical protein [uncultured Maricaulis sp.]|uniref:hypothetical protein n=1 Tax=uncultured Maricaulis sp. TaxID=174710 RepID=UPI0030DC6ACE
MITGTVTVLAGTLALLSSKGLLLHRFAGNLFLGCMVALSLSGLYLSFTRMIVFTGFLAMFALYLVTTGWVAAKRKDGASGLFEKIAMGGIIACALGCAVSGFFTPPSLAAPEDVPPPVAYYVLAVLALAFGILDFSVVRRGGVSGKHRIARHLWRMCFSMFIAVTIFFLGNNNILPEFFRQPALLVAPILSVVIISIFWLLRVLFTRWRPSRRAVSCDRPTLPL